MKKYYVLFISILISSILVSCSSDGGDGGDEDSGITGKWYFYQQGTMVGGQEQLSIYAHSNCGKDYVNLKNNGVFEEMYYSEVGGGCNEEFDNSGHWEVDADGDEFTISYDGEVWIHGDIVILNETTLKVAATENGQNTILVFKRSLDDGGGDASVFAGQWEGAYTGDDTGTFSVNISATGQISGTGYSNNWYENFSLSGTVNSDGSFNAGNTSTGATFTGTITGNNLMGNWNNPTTDESGTFVGQKQ